jgi:cyclic pyranopterin phosphate synthase
MNTNHHHPLTDAFGRQINYLRLSVTDRCNLRCVYCMAGDMTFLPRQQVLTVEETTAIATAFTELGVGKIRLTGGEPLVFAGILPLVAELATLRGLRELVMTTNGLLLPKFALPLREAGISRLNISLDTLDPDRYRAMTRIGDLHQALAGIAAARRAGFAAIKLNAVVLAGSNDHEVADLARFALDGGMDIAFIEEMPLGHIDSHRRRDTQCFSERIREALARTWELLPSAESTGGPARYFRVRGSANKIGFISPMSQNFCSHCNRVRLTAEGQLLLCLGEDRSLDLRRLVRANPGNLEPLKEAIVAAMGRKPERHNLDSGRIDVVRFMNATGG